MVEGDRFTLAVTDGELQLLDSSTLAVTRTVAVGDDIRSLAWWEGGGSNSGRVLAVGKNQNALNVVDPSTGTIARVALGGDPNTVGVEQHNSWAYVGEKDDQIISLIDLINRALSGTFTIPGRIGSMLFDQQGELLFVSLNKDDKLLKLDPNQASLISRVGVTKTLKDVAVNSTTSEGIAISDKDSDFARINLATHAVQTLALPVKADKVVVDAGLNIAIVGTTNNKLSFVNLATTPATLYPQQVDLDGNIKDMAVDATRNITVAVVSDKQRIRVINNVTRTEIAAVQTGDKYTAVAIHAGKGIAYLTTDNKKLSLLDLTTRTITQTIGLNFAVEGIAVDPALNRAVLTTKDNDKAWILNLDTLQLVTSLAMAKNPGAVAIQTDTHIAVVASKDDDSLSLIDLNTNTATLNFNRIDKPTALAISNRFNQVLVVSSDKDDLAIVQLSNPAATISAISPTQAIAGTSTTTLTVTGAHFVDGAVVYFGATALTTTWVSSNTLTATIPAALLTTPGTSNVRVLNPAPAGGTSASLVFTVLFPIPVLTSVAPASVVADNTAKTFTLTGNNFNPPVAVVVSGATGTQTLATSASTLTSAQVTLPASLFTAAGSLSVSVQASGGVSNTRSIAITTAPPTLISTTPTSLKANGTTQSLTLTGSNFVAPVKVRFDGTAIDVTPTSTTQLTVSIPGTLLSTARTIAMTIDAAGGTSSALMVSIATVAPTLVSNAPSTLVASGQGQALTLIGTNFFAPVKVRFEGILLPVTPSSATQLTVSIPGTMLAAAKTVAVSVEAAGGISNVLMISVITLAPNQLPVVQIYQPYGDLYPGDMPITFSANAYDPDGEVVKMELVENNAVLASQLASYLNVDLVLSGGQHNVIVRATDNRGGIGEASVSFYVRPNLADAAFVEAWRGMSNALKSGNLDAAVSFLTTSAAVRYRPVFQALLPNMTTIINSWSNLERITATEDFGEYVISTPKVGGRSLFFVYFVKDANGNILIDSM